jgi:excisionase family DNA binding protein
MATEDIVPRSAALREALEKARGGEPVATSMLTVAEVCEQLRISKWTFYRLKREGKIKTVKIGSRTLISATAMADFVKQLEEGSEG